MYFILFELKKYQFYRICDFLSHTRDVATPENKTIFGYELKFILKYHWFFGSSKILFYYFSRINQLIYQSILAILIIRLIILRKNYVTANQSASRILIVILFRPFRPQLLLSFLLVRTCSVIGVFCSGRRKFPFQSNRWNLKLLESFSFETE